MNRNLSVLFIAGLMKFEAILLTKTNQLAGYLVGLAEGHALANQPLRDVSSKRESGRCHVFHPALVESEGGNHARHRRHHEHQLVEGVKHWLLVLLEVAIIGKRQRLEGGQKPS